MSDWSSDVCSTDLLADRTETGVPGIRAGLAIARHAHHDQTWIDRAQRVPAQAPAFERAGPEVLDDDVGLSDQFTQQRLTFGDTQIERHRFLVARDHRPPQRFAVFAAPPYAHREIGRAHV